MDGRPRFEVEPDHTPDRPVGAATTATGDPADGVSTRLLIDEALASLPEEFRAAVVLRDVAGLDYAAIAEVLDLAPGTVRSRIARGRARLADAISGNQTTPDERHNS